MSHLTMEQLVALRDQGREPGTGEARTHLDSCAECSAELGRLDQRVARLKALPSLAPSRSQWPAVSGQLRAQRSRKRIRWAAMAVAGLAAAASVVLVISLRPEAHATAPQEVALDEAMHRSQQLEQLIQSYNPDARVTDGRTVRMASALEDQIATVDQQLESAQLSRSAARDQALLQLWRQRVGLLDALVDVHLTQASAVGF